MGILCYVPIRPVEPKLAGRHLPSLLIQALIQDFRVVEKGSALQAGARAGLGRRFFTCQAPETWTSKALASCHVCQRENRVK